MKTTKQIIWETKRDLYNRLWDVSFSGDRSLEEGLLLLLKELGKIREEITEENHDR